MMLTNARLELHHALQLGTRVARAYLEERPDDSHTSFTWRDGGLEGEPVQDWRFALRFAALTVEAGGESYPLEGRSLAEAEAWLMGVMQRRGLCPARLARRLHFEIPSHRVAQGGRFVREPGLAELAGWYERAAGLLEGFGGPVRCWPHHFDIASVRDLGGGQTLGAGFSPGDEGHPEPYFYVTPWPYPQGRNLSPPVLGRWHDAGWFGALFPVHELEGRASISMFLRGAAAALENALLVGRRAVAC